MSKFSKKQVKQLDNAASNNSFGAAFLILVIVLMITVVGSCALNDKLNRMENKIDVLQSKQYNDTVYWYPASHIESHEFKG